MLALPLCLRYLLIKNHNNRELVTIGEWCACGYFEDFFWSHLVNIRVYVCQVQCGLGRTGLLWAHEAYEVRPDIMTLAKPLAGGLPIGAVLVTDRVASSIAPGDHGSTFAGGPLVCHAALAVLDRIQVFNSTSYPVV